jgi:hypothetical protein
MSFVAASYLLFFVAALLIAHVLIFSRKKTSTKSPKEYNISEKNAVLVTNVNGEAKNAQDPADQSRAKKMNDVSRDTALQIEVDSVGTVSCAVTSPSDGVDDESDSEPSVTPMYSAVSSPSHLIKEEPDPSSNQLRDADGQERRGSGGQEIQGNVRL